MQQTILIAEDNPDIQSLVRHALEGDGYWVHVVSDGKEALDAYRELAPDLLVLDLMMPRLSGFEVLRELKESGELRRQSPVLILSSRNAEADVTTGFDLGVSDYLTKPFMVSELRARVKALLARGG
jgi:DNA-binding response OmpR family regulator